MLENNTSKVLVVEVPLACIQTSKEASVAEIPNENCLVIRSGRLVGARPSRDLGATVKALSLASFCQV